MNSRALIQRILVFCTMGLPGSIQPARAQLPEFSSCRVLHFTSDNGLPQNSVKSIEYDRVGNMWIATESGLTMFDGNRFINPKTATNSPRICYLMKARNGDLFLTDEFFNLYRVDERNIDIEQVNKAGERGDSLFWQRYTRATREDFWNLPYYKYTINRIIEDANGVHYFRTDQGMLCSFNKRLHTFGPASSGDAIFSFKDKLVQVSPQGKVSIYSDTVFLGNLAIQFQKTPVPPGNLFESGFWFSSGESSFCIYKNSIYRATYTQNNILISELAGGLPDIANIRFASYNEKQNQFAVGSLTEGLYILQPSGFTNRFHQTPLPGIYQNQPIQSIYAQAFLQNGDLLDSYGFRYKAGSSKPSTYFASSMETSLLAKDSENHIWYQTKGKRELCECNDDLSVITRYPLPHTSGYQFMFSMCESGKDTFFFASKNYIFRLVKGKGFRFFDYGVPGLKPLINSIYDAGNGMIWVLTTEGIYFFNKKDYSLTRFAAAGKNYYRVAQRTSGGNILIGTYGQGFYLFANGKMLRLPPDKKGFLNTAHNFTEDGKGFIWISTNNGLFQVKETDLSAYAAGRIKTIYYQYFDKSYGYRNNEFNGGLNTAVTSPGGNFFSFSNMNGIVELYPVEINHPQPSANIIFYNARINDLPVSNEDSIIRLPASFKSLSLNISSPYYGHPNNMNMEYRLSGYDDDWRQVGTDRSIFYNHLPAGTYALEVKLHSGFGEHNFATRSLPVIVEKYWYQEWWGRAVITTLLVGLIFLVIHLWLSRIRRQKKKLEKIIRTRTAELVENNKQLELANRHNEILNSVLLHDVKGPLKLMTDVTDGLSSYWDALTESDRRSYSGEIGKTAKGLYDFVYELLAWVKLRKEEQLVLEPVFLEDIINRSLKLRFEMPYGSAVKISSTVDGSIKVMTNPQALLIIINNIIDNALKYTQAGSLVIAAESNGDKSISVFFADTGKGMEEEKVAYLLSDLNIGEDHIHQDSFKLGYVFIRELLPLIKGHISISSMIDKGTTVVLMLPVPL